MNRSILGALVALAGLLATDMRAQDTADIVKARGGRVLDRKSVV